jgi:hypothetical protein
MGVRGVGVILVGLLLTSGCASSQQMRVPNWERYPDGELAGFLKAPDEHVVQQEPPITVRRARGGVVASGTSATDAHWTPAREQPATNVADTRAGEYRTDLTAFESAAYVVELRGQGASPLLRTAVSRNGAFDFGGVPDGSYTLKVTYLRTRPSAAVTASIMTVIVSQTADPAARIRLP